jgi:hypothetical protein
MAYPNSKLVTPNIFSRDTERAVPKYIRAVSKTICMPSTLRSSCYIFLICKSDVIPDFSPSVSTIHNAFEKSNPRTTEAGRIIFQRRDFG